MRLVDFVQCAGPCVEGCVFRFELVEDVGFVGISKFDVEVADIVSASGSGKLSLCL